MNIQPRKVTPEEFNYSLKIIKNEMMNIFMGKKCSGTTIYNEIFMVTMSTRYQDFYNFLGDFFYELAKDLRHKMVKIILGSNDNILKGNDFYNFDDYNDNKEKVDVLHKNEKSYKNNLLHKRERTTTENKHDSYPNLNHDDINTSIDDENFYEAKTLPGIYTYQFGRFKKLVEIMSQLCDFSELYGMKTKNIKTHAFAIWEKAVLSYIENVSGQSLAMYLVNNIKMPQLNSTHNNSFNSFSHDSNKSIETNSNSSSETFKSSVFPPEFFYDNDFVKNRQIFLSIESFRNIVLESEPLSYYKRKYERPAINRISQYYKELRDLLLKENKETKDIYTKVDNTDQSLVNNTDGEHSQNIKFIYQFVSYLKFSMRVMRYEMKRKEFLFLPESYDIFRNSLERILFIDTKEKLEKGFKEILSNDIQKFIQIINSETINQNFNNTEEISNTGETKTYIDVNTKERDVYEKLYKTDLNKLFFIRKIFEDFSEISLQTVEIIRDVFKKCIEEILNQDFFSKNNKYQPQCNFNELNNNYNTINNDLNIYNNRNNDRLNDNNINLDKDDYIEKIYHFYHDIKILIDLFFFGDNTFKTIFNDLLKDNLNKSIELTEKLALFSHSRMYLAMKISIGKEKICKIRILYQKLKNAIENKELERCLKETDNEFKIKIDKTYKGLENKIKNVKHHHSYITSNENISEFYANEFLGNISDESSIDLSPKKDLICDKFYKRSIERDEIIKDILILLPSKDKFESQYHNYMSKRLLEYNYDYEKEQNFILKMKNLLSNEFIRKAFRMFRDINFSINFNQRVLTKIINDLEIQKFYKNNSIFYNQTLIKNEPNHDTNNSINDKSIKENEKINKECYNQKLKMKTRYSRGGHINLYNQIDNYSKNEIKVNSKSYVRPMNNDLDNDFNKNFNNQQNKPFKNYCSQNNNLKNNLLGNQSSDNKIDLLYSTPFFISILTQCIWPIDFVNNKDLIIPPELEIFYSKIKENYKSEFKKRKLIWIYELGYVEIVICTDKEYQVRMNLYQYSILRLFNEYDALGFDDILKMTGMNNDECFCVVDSLLFQGFLLKIDNEDYRRIIDKNVNLNDKKKNQERKYKVANLNDNNKMNNNNLNNNSNSMNNILTNIIDDYYKFNTNFFSESQQLNVADIKFYKKEKIKKEKINVDIILSSIISKIMKKEKEIEHKSLIKLIEKKISRDYYEIKNCFKIEISRLMNIFKSLVDKGVIEINDDIVFYVP
ncbi:Cullin-1 [Dictyocoela muelleri]|nr:Cullin-1 [Dictyocoela muelleri]